MTIAMVYRLLSIAQKESSGIWQGFRLKSNKCYTEFRSQILTGIRREIGAMNRMKLGDFIAQTIREIISGVSQSQKYAKENGASVNPPHVNWSDEKQNFCMVADEVLDEDEVPIVTAIDFDVLLTIGDDDKAQGGVAIFAASLGLGVRAETKECSAPLKLDTRPKQVKLCLPRSATCQERDGISPLNSKRKWCWKSSAAARVQQRYAASIT